MKREKISAKASEAKNKRKTREERGVWPRPKTIITDYDKRFDRTRKRKDIEREKEEAAESKGLLFYYYIVPKKFRDALTAFRFIHIF